MEQNKNNSIAVLTETIETGVEQARSLCDDVSYAMDKLGVASDMIQNVTEVYNMHQRTEQMRLWSDVQITSTIARYKLCHEFLSHTFEERDGALQKNYDVLDRAIENGDKELIIKAMQGISSIVTTSPLQELEEFTKIFNDPNAPLLDF